MFKISQTYEIWPSKSSKVLFLWKLRLAHRRRRITLQSIYQGSKYALRVTLGFAWNPNNDVGSAPVTTSCWNYDSEKIDFSSIFFLIMLDFVAYSKLSKIKDLKLSLCKSKLKYHKLVSKNYPSNFELSKYHKLTKSDPQNLQKFFFVKIKTSCHLPPYYSLGI